MGRSLWMSAVGLSLLTAPAMGQLREARPLPPDVISPRQPVPRAKRRIDIMPPPPPVVVELPVAPANQARRQTIFNQLMTRYRPLLREEYLFARRVCRFTAEERKEIALAGERALRAAMGEQARRMTGGKVNPSSGPLQAR